MLIAATLMSVGFAYDAGSGAKELTSVFAGTYVVGCIFAVLAVRQSGIFTAVIQPPLLLFGAVPAAYFVFTGSQLSNIKDTLINCAYPLIERFPLMFFTSAVVLLIGMARWYTGMSSRRGTPSTAAAEEEPSGGGLVAAVSSKISALLAGLGNRRQGRKPDGRRGGEAQPSVPADRQAAPAGPRAAPRRRDHGMPGPRTRSTSSRWPSGRAARAPEGRPSRPSNRAASRAQSPAGVGRCRPPIAAPDTSAPSVGDATTRTSRPCTAATATALITRYRACAIAVAKTATTARYAQYRRPPRDRAVESWEYDI